MSEDHQILEQMQALLDGVRRRIDEVTYDCRQDLSLKSKRILLAELAQFVGSQRLEVVELREQLQNSPHALAVFASLERKLEEISRLIGSS